MVKHVIVFKGLFFIHIFDVVPSFQMGRTNHHFWSYFFRLASCKPTRNIWNMETDETPVLNFKREKETIRNLKSSPFLTWNLFLENLPTMGHGCFLFPFCPHDRMLPMSFSPPATRQASCANLGAGSASATFRSCRCQQHNLLPWSGEKESWDLLNKITDVWLTKWICLELGVCLLFVNLY